MSEKDANDSAYPTENGNSSETAEAVPNEEEAACAILDPVMDRKSNNGSLDLESCLPSHESPLKKEENPFSFKKFLNSSSQTNKGARKKIYTPSNASSSDSSESLNVGCNRNLGEMNSRMNANDMSSVLPDFVQDHLVIEQCYLSGSSSDIDFKNLNLQNLPDLNVEHRNVHFMLNVDGKINHHSESGSENLSSNLPDFTLGANNIQSCQNNCKSERLPDFALHARTDGTDDLRCSRRSFEINNGNNSSQNSRQRAQISSSPSVPLDLPSYENNESNPHFPIPFDLTAPVEDSNNACRGRTSNETVSKSLPDFLSDGPIKKELDDSLQNGLSSDPPSSRVEDRLRREIDQLRRQLMEKNRKIGRLERELENLRVTDQMKMANLEQSFEEVENTIRHNAKRAQNAESKVLKLKQENKALKSEVSALRSENHMLRLNNCGPSEQSQEMINQKIAKELKSAANQAENSLKSLLIGVKNLRSLADLMENQFQDANQDFHNYPSQDSASGPSV